VTRSRPNEVILRRCATQDEPQVAASPDGSFAPVTPFGGEELVADSRNGLTSRQIVDGRLQALLGGDSGTAVWTGHRTSAG